MTLDTRPVTAAAAPTTRLDALLARIDDPALAEQLRQEVRARDRREFGLVFEHHLPETVELPGLRIQTGRKVRILPERGTVKPAGPTVWTVVEIDGLLAKLESSPDPDRVETVWQRIENLVAVADFADPIYPGLKLTDRLNCDTPDRPWHTLINAENYHALQALQYTHAGQIDTIYIDPPYNTGNDDWIYADRHVAAEDSFRHSKWLSFMERRLLLAKQLLKPTGVIIVAIGDDEHHRLRMLMDQVFGEQNFIADIVWTDKGSNLSKFTSGGTDYMLVYGRDAAGLSGFAEVKTHAPEMIAIGQRVRAGCQAEAVQAELRAYLRENKDTLPKGIPAYNSVDEQGRVFCTTNMDNSLYRPNLRYPITDPATGIVFPPPKNGWTVQESTLAEWLSSGRVLFRESGPVKKVFLEEAITALPSPVFTSPRLRATKHLSGVLGDKRFPFPKDHTVLMRWIGMVTPADGTVLDFFGGSGSTLEAVLRLNAQDGGTRRCILVTNNEVGSKTERDMRKRGLRDGDPEWEAAGVCEYVTKPRIRTILTGVRPDGSEYTDTVAGNVAMYDLTYEDPLHVELDLAFERVAPMLWLAAGAKGDQIDQVPADGWAANGHYGILTGIDNHRGFIDFLTTERVAFIVTDDQGQYQQIAAQLPHGCRAIRLYESYLRTFQIGANAA